MKTTHRIAAAPVLLLVVLYLSACPNGVPLPNDPVDVWVAWCTKTAKDPDLGCEACVPVPSCGYCFSEAEPLEGKCMYTADGNKSAKCDSSWAQNDTQCPPPP